MSDVSIEAESAGSDHPVARREIPFLGLAHAVVFLATWLILNPATFFIISGRMELHEAKGALEAVATLVWGPFASTIEGRNSDNCYRNAWMLMPYAAPALLVAVVVQYFWRPQKRAPQAVRLTIWGIGLLVWFWSGAISIAMNLG